MPPEPETPKRSAGRRVLIVLAAFLLWTTLALVFASQLYLAGLSWPLAIAWSLPRFYAWGLVTPAVFAIDRWLARRFSIPARVAWHVPLAVAVTTLTVVLRLVRRLLGSDPPDIAEFFLDRFYADLPIYAVIAGISFARLYAADVRRSTREAHELALRSTDLERRLVESQLQSLRAQLHPHFLFNALNTISSFTESNPQMARRLMAQLGDLLRASLRHTAHPLVTLGEELTFLDDFIAIESARFEGRLEICVRADDDLLGVMVPGFLLQPLVENAIRHGVGTRLSGGRVEIAVTGDPAALRISVRDNGVGLRSDWNFDRHAGVGLRNIAARLEHLYGRADLMRLVPLPTGGLDVQIDLPGRPVATVH
jgi:two-component system, LytTR family, sensor kinase